MKVISGGVNRTTVEKNCSFVLETSIGEITMCGEIKNGKVKEETVGPSFWNKDKFNKLSKEEKQDVVSAVNNELVKLTQ